MKQSTKNWLKAADDDLLAIENLITREELTNIVAFHAQQCIEKTFKAVLEEYNIPVIRTHNIETLYLKASGKIAIEVDQKVIAELDKLYLDSRYPGDFGLLPSGKPTPEETAIYFREAKIIRLETGKQLSR
jgi:HEPN domain-containing protein